MKFKPDISTKRFFIFLVLLTFFHGLVFNFADFYDTPVRNGKDFLEVWMHWGMILVGTFGLIYLLAINKYVFAFTYPFLALICTVLAYFRYTANVSLTPLIIELAVVNDARTSAELVSIQLLFLMLLSLSFSGGCIYYRWKYITVKKWYAHVLPAFFFIYFVNGLIPRLVAPVSERMPFSVYYSIKYYLESQQVISQERGFITKDITYNTDSLIVVVVIGESLRADHLGMNGYKRNTTPLLSQDTHVISFPRIYTIPVYTHVSVPHMLTRADSTNLQRAYEEPSFITLFKHAGFRSSWLANQEGVANYIYFMNECDTLLYANAGRSVYSYDKWLDTDLLPLFDEELHRKEANKLILFHTIGSHWWYNSHFTEEFEIFRPTIKSRIVSSCTQEELINSYDNTILFTDYFLSETIRRLKDKNAILFYLSDHGESLGEDGYYLHAADHPTLHYPACMVWFSSEYENKYPEKTAALRNNRNNFYHTDFLFHSVLDAASISTRYKKDELSILK